MSAKTLTVVFTDIKGFTARTSKSTRAQMVKVLEKHEQLLRPIILQHGGRVVKTIGDAFLLTFESPTNAVLCGLRMQACLRAYNASAASAERIDIRIAMNTGEVELIGDDVFGETVNLASRVEGITDAGEVYFTESTYLVMNKAEVPTSQVGDFRFEGIPEQITVYRVVQDENLDLYRQVVKSQAVPEPVQPGASNVPEGAFSTRLLYSAEQRRALESRRHRDRLVSGVVTAVVLAALGAGYLGIRAYRHAAHRRAAAQRLDAGQVNAALDRLAALRQARPDDPELAALLSRAIAADIAALTAAERYDEALRRIEEHRTRYPDLAVIDQLLRDTRLARALWTAPRDPRSGQDLLEALHLDYPRDDGIAVQLARHTAEHFDVRRAFHVLQEVEARGGAGAWAGQEWILEAAGRYLQYVYRSDDDLLALIDRHFYDTVRPQLLAWIGDPDEHSARRNAYTLLSRHGDLTALDEFRFFTAELFYRTIIERTFREETFAYFEGLLAGDLPEEIRRALPIALPPARVLHEGTPDRERALPIIQALFPEALQDGS